MHLIPLTILLIVGLARTPRRLIGLGSGHYVLLLFILYGAAIFPAREVQGNPVLIWSLAAAMAILVIGSYFVPHDPFSPFVIIWSRIKGEDIPPSALDPKTADRIVRENWGKAEFKREALEEYLARNGSFPDGTTSLD